LLEICDILSTAITICGLCHAKINGLHKLKT
jgi:hypothetical protein